jgi:hypothetical protein
MVGLIPDDFGHDPRLPRIFEGRLRQVAMPPSDGRPAWSRDFAILDAVDPLVLPSVQSCVKRRELRVDDEDQGVVDVLVAIPLGRGDEQREESEVDLAAGAPTSSKLERKEQPFGPAVEGEEAGAGAERAVSLGDSI